MQCPHCLDRFHEQWRDTALTKDGPGEEWVVRYQICPACRNLIVQLLRTFAGSTQTVTVHPKKVSRRPLPADVPVKYAEDFTEACLIFDDSPKASAALSRRCLQNLLRDEAGVKHGNLANEIQQVLNSGKLPTHLGDAMDAVRNIGNFAAHPIKSTSTGEILPVEPGEAEWLLETLESLLDFYCVQPARLKQKRAALDQKLADAGKPPMK